MADLTADDINVLIEALDAWKDKERAIVLQAKLIELRMRIEAEK